MSWLINYVAASASTDNFQGRLDQLSLLSSGLYGETGSILAELKKRKREGSAYVKGLSRIQEELGDFLWYFFRIVAICDSSLINRMDASLAMSISEPENGSVADSLHLGISVGRLIEQVNASGNSAERSFLETWELLRLIANDVGVKLETAAAENIKKIESRWPREKLFAPLFDEDYEEEEQLPRTLRIEFRQRVKGGKTILRCNGLNFGDPLTDNIESKDGYSFHDIFHFSYAVFLGWSPVIRALLRSKRKSNPAVDEAQDGARAVIIEEAVSAVVFSHIKTLDAFDHFDHIEFDLLKMIEVFVQGYEVDRIPLWQWERALIEGYQIFKKLRQNGGGTVVLTMNGQDRSLLYTPPNLSS